MHIFALAIFALAAFGDRDGTNLKRPGRSLLVGTFEPEPSMEHAKKAKLPEPNFSVEELVSVVVLPTSSRNPKIRQAAAVALGQMGGAASEAGPALSDALEFDDQGPVRLAAAVALGQIGGAASVAGSAALAKALGTDRDELVRDAAAVALGQMGDFPAAKAGSRALSKALRADQEKWWFVRKAAALALGEMWKYGGKAASTEEEADSVALLEAAVRALRMAASAKCRTEGDAAAAAWAALALDKILGKTA